MRAAAAKLERPIQWIVRAKDSGVDAFKANGSVILAPVKEWIESNLEELMASKDELPRKEQKLAEEIRRLQIRNDRDIGKLIPRAWVNERIQRIAGDINATRAKSESEDALLFAAAMGDVPKCRVIVRTIWDRIMVAHQELAKHLAE